MKRRINVLLAFFLMISVAGSALADPSVLRVDGLFLMQFDGFTGSEVSAMNLKRGDLIEITGSIDSGAVEIIVKRDLGDVLFVGSGIPAPGDFIEIPEDGVYRFSVSATGVHGSIRIAQTAGVQPSQASLPLELERVIGTLEYEIEYEPKTFRMETMDAGDFFFTADPGSERLYDTYVSVFCYAESLDDYIAALAAEEDAELMPTLTIDYRAARCVRFQLGDADDSPVIVYTAIESDADTVLVVTAAYLLGQQEAVWPAMERMIQSIQFTL